MKQFFLQAAIIFAAPIILAQTPTPAAPSPSSARTAEAERVTVVGGAIERRETDTGQAVTILSEDNLKLQTAATLGDTLATQPGIGGSGFTAGASRPVIR